MTKTINLDGLTSVKIKQSAYDMARFCWIKNLSEADVFASCVNADCTENADEVRRISSGEFGMLDTESYETLYLNGSGAVEIVTSALLVCPFDRGGKGGGSYELPIATTEILGGVMPDGTTITVDENGVISTVGGHTVDTLLDITFNCSTDSMPYGGKTIILPRNITDYKFLYCTHAYVKSASYDKNTSVDDGLLNKSLIPTETLEWDYWITETTFGYGTLLYDIEASVEQPENPVKVYIKSENELYFKPMSSSIYVDHRFLMIGIK